MARLPIDPVIEPLVEQVRQAAATGRPLSIVGQGSKGFYGEPMAGEPLHTTACHGIVDYQPEELYVRVRAGTSLATLESALAEHGQCLPFEPPRFGGAGTVGGMVAAGLSGPARASVGCVRDHVLGASLVNGRGEHLSFGGQVMKNVAGYDVSRVLAGSLGILGVLTELSLKVMPVPPADITLAFEFDQAEALARLGEWRGQAVPLNASLWRMQGEAGLLMLRLRGARAAVESARVRLGGEAMPALAAREFWDACRDHRAPGFAVTRDDPRELWRVSLPQTAPALALGDTAPIVEWHGAQRWYRLAPGSSERIRQQARAMGGHATLFRPAPATTGGCAPRFDAVDGVALRIHRALKRAFDPDRLFNPGRLYPDL